MKLPKLYRVVYLELEWVTDECWDGDHYQDTGVVYPRARVVIKGGVKVWQIIDTETAKIALYDDELSIPVDTYSSTWHSVNLYDKAWLEENKHNPDFSRSYTSIAEQKSQQMRNE